MKSIVTWGVALVLALTSADAVAESEVHDYELFERWLRASPEVASWRMQVGSARFDVVTAGLLPNPNIQFAITQIATGQLTSSKTQYYGQLTIPLPIFGQIGKRVDAAEALVTVAEVTVRQSVWQRAGDVQAAMLDRAYGQARVEMLEKNLDELVKIEGIIKSRTAAGAGSSYDVLRVGTSVASMRAELDNARIARDRAEATLIGLIGDPSLAGAPLTIKGLASFTGPEDEGQLIAMALARRPDLELARRNAYANQLAASAWRRNAVTVPSLFVGANVGQGPENLFITGGISIDLPTFMRNQGLVGRAENDAEAQRVLARSLETRIRMDVIGAWRARQAAKRALEDFRAKGISAAAELMTRAEVTYQAGNFKIAELFDAYQTVWDARSQELDLERQFADSEAAVERDCMLLPLGHL
jgi:cobalt-zinc-cadmium efflux system outer membrane protein